MAEETLWRFDPFRLDIADRRLWNGQQEVKLASLAFNLLAYFVKNPNRLLTKDELLRAIEKPMSPDEILYGLITEVRKALGDDQHKPQFIKTVHREGYRFITTVEKDKDHKSTDRRSPEFVVDDARPPEQQPQPIFDTWQIPPGFVGRDTELAKLHKLLGKALDGERQIVFLTGEPGIGKTALVDAFFAQFSNDPIPWIGRGQCVEQFGAGEAYLPILDALAHLSQRTQKDLFIRFFARHAPTWLMQMPALLDSVDIDALQRKTQGATRERMLREFVEAVETFTTHEENQPPPLLVLVLEDLHWSDHSTLDLLSTLARRRAPARLFMIATYRPTEGLADGHPLRAVTQELRGHNQSQELALTRLGLTAIEKYLETRFPNNAFPTRFAELLYQRTAGNPLFMSNLVTDLMTRELLVQEDGNWILLSSLEDIEAKIPESSRQLIERQMERLSVEAQQILEAASVAGAEFPTGLVAAALDVDDETVEDRCEELAQHEQFLRRAGISEWPNGIQTARYGFRHALYQELWHERVPIRRRQRFHLRIGERLEQAYTDRTGEIAAEAAVHFGEAGDHRRALQFRHQAAMIALQRSAYQEVIIHLAKGLAHVQALPAASERLQHELSLQTVLGPALMATRGWQDDITKKAYDRARELCRELGETPQLFPTLFGLWAFHTTRAEHKTAYDFGVQLLRLARRLQDSSLLIEASWAAGCSSYYLGNFAVAREHLEQGVTLYDLQQHRNLALVYGQDPGVSCFCYLALALWKLGYPDQALRRSNEALSLAREHTYPFTLDWALTNSCLFQLLRRSWPTVSDLAQEGLALSIQHGFRLSIAAFTVCQNLARTMRSRRTEDIARHIEECLSCYPALGIDQNLPWNRTLIAENYGRINRIDEGLAILAEGFAVMERTEERHHEAEMWRVKGELTLQLENQKAKGKRRKKLSVVSSQLSVPDAQSPTSKAHSEAEACFLKAIEVAQRQHAKAFELRAATSLSRFWKAHGKLEQARKILSEICDWFTEGLETEDLKQARILLAELS